MLPGGRRSHQPGPTGGRVSQERNKRRSSGERYALLPLEVLTHPSYTTLPHYAQALLVAMAAQYTGKNNGDLSMPWSTAQLFGIRSKEHLVDGLRLLKLHGLIMKTRQGGKRPLGPTLWAITWRPIDDLPRKFDPDIRSSFAAPNTWQRWASPGTARGTK